MAYNMSHRGKMLMKEEESPINSDLSKKVDLKQMEFLKFIGRLIFQQLTILLILLGLSPDNIFDITICILDIDHWNVGILLLTKNIYIYIIR